MDVKVRGEQAQRLLDDEVLQEALGKIEETLLTAWKNSVVGESAKREAAYALYCGVQALRAQLTAFWTAAKLEADRGEA